MASSSQDSVRLPPTFEIGSGGTLVAFIDRWIYVLMAALILITVFVGFIPDSFQKVAAVRAGLRPPFPPALHVHAVLMGSWLTLLLAQTTLMATGHRGWHKQLGIVSVALAPAIVVAGVVLVPTMYRPLWTAAQVAPTDTAAIANLTSVSNILLIQIRVGIGFAVLIGLALLARRTNPGLHKRLMILATLLPLPAAIDRIGFLFPSVLPSTLPDSPLASDIYTLLWALPMFGWDLCRLGRLHWAYIIWLGITLPLMIADNVLWNSPWWAAVVPRLMGVT
jgi:hypothetical protein